MTCRPNLPFKLIQLKSKKPQVLIRQGLGVKIIGGETGILFILHLILFQAIKNLNITNTIVHTIEFNDSH